MLSNHGCMCEQCIGRINSLILHAEDRFGNMLEAPNGGDTPGRRMVLVRLYRQCVMTRACATMRFDADSTVNLLVIIRQTGSTTFQSMLHLYLG